MAQARELCKKEIQCGNGNRYTVFQPEEMVACFQSSKGLSASQRTRPLKPATQCGAPGSICMSWILDAQNYPSLCDWLGYEQGWLFDPQNIDCVLKATEQIRMDDERCSRSPAPCKKCLTPELQSKLRVVPVCGNCLCIYTLIHTVVTKIRVHRLDLWAGREQQRQRGRRRSSTVS